MTALFPEPRSREKKPSPDQIPVEFLKKARDVLGSEIVGADIAWGGFSASAGFIFSLDSGEKVFAKGSHPGDTSHGTQNLRQEISAYENILVLKEISPAYLGVVHDGDEDGWMLGFWEFLDPVKNSVSVEARFELMRRWQKEKTVNEAVPAAYKKPYIQNFFRDEGKWNRFRDDSAAQKKFISLFEDEYSGREWLLRSISALCTHQQKTQDVSLSNGLIHGDVRLDNFIFSNKGLFVIDWPNACFGPTVLDDVFFFSGIEGLESTMMPSPKDSAFFAILASVSGYFAEQAYRDVPPLLPRLRWMQKCLLLAQLRMLARAEIIDFPPQMRGQSVENL